MIVIRKQRLAVIIAAVLTACGILYIWLWKRTEGKNNYRASGHSINGICPNVRRSLAEANPTEGEVPWQYLQESKVVIFIYSAIYDDRDEKLGRAAQVKVVAVGTEPRGFTPYCQLWYEDERSPLVGLATMRTISTPEQVTLSGDMGDEGAATDEEKGGMKGNVRMLHQYIFTCELVVKDPAPTHVSLVVDQACQQPEVFVEIQRPPRDLHLDIGACVPSSSGRWDAVHMVEWIELQRLLGVSEFQIYNTSLTRHAFTTLKKYAAWGILQKRPLPTPDGSSSDQWKPLLDSVALSDCLLRNVYRYKRALLVKFHHVVVPRMASTYSKMLDEVERRMGAFAANAESFRFDKVTFHTNCWRKTWGRTLMFKYFVRNSESDSSDILPLLVDPARCLGASRHGCLTGGRSGPALPWKVSSNTALSHFYKLTDDCEDSNGLNQDGTHDEILLKYKLKVIAASPIKLEQPWHN